ncbi:antibiotic biosynthesis monooxygenase [Yinghuangia soli]|uniref:Antibiotic biosynthesis monooxygenase n=1 Tax=Yinghuangia soli TaxID=2908204 RepID=A0AA41Q867_9ACTN|nr:antibiotic biosynthesis monooxygenase [Yinghuangia soli]MCF2533404.1 antibiotic biosynthesis monooxygenase [Yinghuangia soli]
MTQETVRRSTTLVVARYARPGAEADFEHALEALTAAAREFDGHDGATLIRPSEETGGRYLVIFHFVDEPTQDAWMNSHRRAELLAEADRHSNEQPHVISDDPGSDLWLTLPPPADAGGKPKPGVPPRWKAAISVWLGLFPLLTVMNLLVVPHLKWIPGAVRPVLVSIVMVALMTYAALPLIQKLLRPWLTKPRKS